MLSKTAGWDFGRMIFFCFTYLPLDENQPWLAALKGIHKFGLAMLDDVRRLKFVQEDSKAEEEEQEQEEEETPHNMPKDNIPPDIAENRLPVLNEVAVYRAAVLLPFPERKGFLGCGDRPFQNALKRVIKIVIADAATALLGWTS